MKLTVLERSGTRAYTGHMAKTPKRPRDTNQLAKMIVDIATGEQPDTPADDDTEGKDPAAIARGRKGGKKGGKARAEALTNEERSDIAKKAAAARWGDK